jgi:hypothetical protein
MTDMGHYRGAYFLNDNRSNLYGLLASEWRGQAIAVLDEFADASDEAALMTVARILAQAPREVLFDGASLVAKVLQKAERLGSEAAERIFRALLPTNSGMIWTWEGQRLTKEEHERDRAGQVALTMPRGSIESRFFHVGRRP